LKSVSARCYIQSRRKGWGVSRARRPFERRANLRRTKTMTIEIFYLAAQIERWLNQRVARHLEAQAAKLTR